MITQTQKNTFRKNVVAKALSHVGDEEQPRYSNRSQFVDACNTYVGNGLGDAWCIAMACYIAGMTATSMKLIFADTLLAKTGYCPTEYTHAKAKGTAIDPHAVVAGAAEVQAGDIMLEFIHSEDGGQLPHHAEIVITPPSKGKSAFTTVGGNTIPDGFVGNEAQGFGVFKKQRNCTDTITGGHNKYVFVRLI